VDLGWIRYSRKGIFANIPSRAVVAQLGHAGGAQARARHADVCRAASSGPRFEFGFSFSSELVKVYSIHFLADLWKMIVNVVDV